MPQKMFSWMNPKLEIKEAKKYGRALTARKSGLSKVYHEIGSYSKSVFVREDIKKGEMLIVMGGYILTIEDDNNLKGIVADKPIEISDIFFIGPRKPSDIDRMPQCYVNHSCNPNAGFKGQIFMVAMRKIRGRGRNYL